LGITIVAILMILFGLAEVVTGFTHNFIRLITSQTSISTHTTQPLIPPLHEFRRGDVTIAGGKGANLGELIRAGFTVPAGFVVTTTAYDCFVVHNNLGEAITRVLGEETGNGAEIRGAFEGAPIPPEIEHSVLAAYDQLG
jgi:pyruvate,water dikinase